MSNRQKILQIYDLIFNESSGFSENAGSYDITSTKRGLRKVETNEGDWLYIEQNPHTNSKWARLAKDGHKIMWVIFKPLSIYVVRVADGKIKMLAGKKKIQQIKEYRSKSLAKIKHKPDEVIYDVDKCIHLLKEKGAELIGMGFNNGEWMATLQMGNQQQTFGADNKYKLLNHCLETIGANRET